MELSLGPAKEVSVLCFCTKWQCQQCSRASKLKFFLCKMKEIEKKGVYYL